MSIFLFKRGIGLRTLAVAFVAYSALASARGLIPHLCATLSSLPEASAAHGESLHSCCAPQGAAGTHALAAPQHDCAFCLIVHTPVQPISADVLKPQALSLDLVIASNDSRLADPMIGSANFCRAPPFS